MILIYKDKNISRQRIKCACSDCENETVCLTQFGCYSAFGLENCADTEKCYGCFNNKFQLLQVKLLNYYKSKSSQKI